MTYGERLNCWAIARLLPSQQWVIVARFHRRSRKGCGAISDAEGHHQFLCRVLPNVPFKVVFDLVAD